jgi:hypothetical protein
LTDVIQNVPAVETARMRISRRPRFIEGNLLARGRTNGQSHKTYVNTTIMSAITETQSKPSREAYGTVEEKLIACEKITNQELT